MTAIFFTQVTKHLKADTKTDMFSPSGATNNLAR